MNDGQDECSVWLNAVHHAIALHENCADGLVVGLGNPATDEWELAQFVGAVKHPRGEFAKGIVKFHLTLSASEPGTSWFQAQGGGTITAGGTNSGAYQTYTGPVDITLNKSGQMTFRYYSVDTAGNTEAWREVVLK